MLIGINETDPRPIFVQIAVEVKDQVRRGLLRPGDELPSVRELAATLGINLHTVHRAYQKLRDEGVIRLRLGRRARIAPPKQRPLNQELAETEIAGRLQELITDAYHLGLSTRELRRMVDGLLQAQEEGEAKP